MTPKELTKAMTILLNDRLTSTGFSKKTNWTIDKKRERLSTVFPFLFYKNTIFKSL